MYPLHLGLTPSPLRGGDKVDFSGIAFCREVTKMRRHFKRAGPILRKSEKIFMMLFVAGLALVPVLAVSVPRILAFIPPLVGIIGFACYGFVFREKPQFSKPAFIIIGVIVGLSFLSALWAIDPAQSFERAGKSVALLVGGAFLISLAFCLKVEWLRAYAWVWPLTVFLTALAICAEINFGFPVYRMTRGFSVQEFVPLAVLNRPTVTLALLFLPSFAIMRHYVSLWRSVFVALVCLSPLMFMTESQSAQLGIAVAVAAALLYPYKWKHAWAFAAIVIYVIMLATPFVAIWAFNNIVGQVEAVPALGDGGGYAGARMEIWDYVSRYALQNPLYGFGVEATRQVPSFGSTESYQQGQTILHPHNFVLQIWIEFGLLGITLAGAIIAYLLRQIQMTLSVAQARIALPTMAATMAVASTSYGIWQGWWLGLLMVVTAYCICAVRLRVE